MTGEVSCDILYLSRYKKLNIIFLISKNEFGNGFLEKKGKGKMINFIVSLIVGAICGWLAGIIMKSNNGIIINIILGVVGGAVAGALFGVLGISFHGIIGNIICGVIGACLLIFVARLIKNKK